MIFGQMIFGKIPVSVKRYSVNNSIPKIKKISANFQVFETKLKLNVLVPSFRIFGIRSVPYLIIKNPSSLIFGTFLVYTAHKNHSF
jgi:hypothetical protein